MQYYTHWQVHHKCLSDSRIANIKILDLKSDNLLVPFENSSVIGEYISQQKDNPPLYKEADGRRVYQSRADFGCLRKGVRLLKISDFGAAVFGNRSTPYFNDIQPDQFKAPEVLLRAGWTYSADIWNLGMMVRITGTANHVYPMPLTPALLHSCGSLQRANHS